MLEIDPKHVSVLQNKIKNTAGQEKFCLAVFSKKVIAIFPKKIIAIFPKKIIAVFSKKAIKLLHYK